MTHSSFEFWVIFVFSVAMYYVFGWLSWFDNRLSISMTKLATLILGNFKTTFSTSFVIDYKSFILSTPCWRWFLVISSFWPFVMKCETKMKWSKYAPIHVWFDPIKEISKGPLDIQCRCLSILGNSAPTQKKLKTCSNAFYSQLTYFFTSSYSMNFWAAHFK